MRAALQSFFPISPLIFPTSPPFVAVLPSVTPLASSLPVPVCIVGVVIRSMQHPDLMRSRVLWCFSASATECCGERPWHKVGPDRERRASYSFATHEKQTIS